MEIPNQPVRLVLIIGLSALSLIEASNLEKIYRLNKVEGSIVGAIGSRLTAHSSIECSTRCTFDPQCKACQFSVSVQTNCILIHPNSTINSGQTFISDQQNTLFKLGCQCTAGDSCQQDYGADSSRSSNWTLPDQPAFYRSFDTGDNIQLEGGSQIVIGKVNNAVSTDGAMNQWVKLGNLSTVACLSVPDSCGTTGGAMSVWIQIVNCSNSDGIISSLDSGTGFQVSCFMDGVGHAVVVTTGTFVVVAPKPTGWFHLVLNFMGPGDGQGITVYHDGVNVGTNSRMLPSSEPVGGGEVAVGRFFTPMDAFYASVMMDELLFFNRSLSSDEIQILYNMHK